MTYFLSEQPLHPGESLELSGEEAHHAAGTRRLRAGETFALQDPSGARFRVEVEGGGSRALRVRVLEPIAPPPLPERRVTLIQAAVKAKAAEWILQKVTELGVARLVFFSSAHATVALKELHHDLERGRWQRIAWEACKQCDRQFPPELHIAENLSAAIAWAGPAERSWLFHPDSGGPPPPSAGVAAPSALVAGPSAPSALVAERSAPSARLIIGPEGGLTPEEVRLAWDAGFEAVSLGPLVLRAETAAVAGCALALLA